MSQAKAVTAAKLIQPSVDVLAAQVREALKPSTSYAAVHEALAALDALVALVKEWQDATERAIANGAGNVDRLHERINELKAERDALVARVTEAEANAEERHETAMRQFDIANELRTALADARNALEHYAAPEHWSDDTPPESHNTAGYLAFCYDGGQEFPWTVAREVLARLDGSSE